MKYTQAAKSDINAMVTNNVFHSYPVSYYPPMYKQALDIYLRWVASLIMLIYQVYIKELQRDCIQPCVQNSCDEDITCSDQEHICINYTQEHKTRHIIFLLLFDHTHC